MNRCSTTSNPLQSVMFAFAIAGLTAVVAWVSSSPARATTDDGVTTYYGDSPSIVLPDAAFVSEPDTAAPASLEPSVPPPSVSPVVQPMPQPETPATDAAVAPPASVMPDPVLVAVRTSLTAKGPTQKGDAADFAAAKTFYEAQSAPLWVLNGIWSPKAEALAKEISSADDWGLEASAFDVPSLAAGATIEAQANAEFRLTIAAMRYARFARGGRVEPLAISNIFDMKPPLKDPGEVLAGLAGQADAAAFIRSMHPKHPEFERLRQALLKTRGPREPEPKIDEALLVKLPAGPTIKPGMDHADVALLRKRLKVEADAGAAANKFDANLEVALAAFQEANGIKANGVLNTKTRTALNKEGEPKTREPAREADRILVNLERWRWMPEDMGSFYVINNVPEFSTSVMKVGNEIFKERIIVGMPTWPTPILMANMNNIVFHPEWGMPDGIKMKELLPRLRQYSGGGGFFDQLFGGGSSGSARVLAAYNLRPSIDGRPVNPDSVDWSKVDIRRYSFVQPAGSTNPLGNVKFRFPNRHDVYMHDTPQRDLFRLSNRALSHGCMRVQNPRRLAEVLLGEDKGWSPEKVGSMYTGGNDVALSKPIPVYMAYFTARVSPDGKYSTYSDLYGHDGRVLSAMAGRAVRYQAPEAVNEDLTTSSVEPAASSSEQAAAGDPDGDVSAAPVTKKSKKAEKQRKREAQTAGDITANALSGLLSN